MAPFRFEVPMKPRSVLFVVLATVLLAGCHPKRPPAVLTDPGRTAREHPPATAMPEDQPINTGPDIQSIGRDNPTGEDFSVNDQSGENGPLEDVHFDYDQAVLSDQARAILEKHALWLQNHRQAKVTVEGHCDERGTVDYNLALGDKRARAASEYLVSLGVAGDRLRTVSYGKEKPLDPASTDQAWSRNRRAHFVVSR
jgi:peptidoglycan-associated lipoprotein